MRVSILFVFIVIVGCTTKQRQSIPEVEHDLVVERIILDQKMVDRGKVVFKKQCASCHGSEGQGVMGQGATLNSPDFLGLADDEFIKRTIENGRPQTMMASYKKARKVKKEIGNLVAYIRSWQNDYPIFKKYKVDRAAKFSGDSGHGAKVFKRYCSYCHGPKGEGFSYGGAGTGIGLSGFLKVASDDYILKTIQVGRAGTAMKPFGHGRGLATLDAKEMNDVVVFLRSLE
jgi:mono/diheme cytochrome c family protein